MAKSRCILGCELIEDEEIRYFEFPTSRGHRKKWLDAMNITTKVTVDAVICIKHFDENDYECVRGKIRLKRKVVPSLLKGGEQVQTTPNNEVNENNSEPIQEKTSDVQQESRVETDEIPPAEPIQKPPDKPDEVDKGPPEKTNAVVGTVFKTFQANFSEAVQDLEKTKNRPDEQIDKANNNSPSSITCSTKKGSRAEANVVKNISRKDVADETKEDIEDIITNYHIRNKNLVNKLVSPPRNSEPIVIDDPSELEPFKEAEPVFIEVSVDRDPNTSDPGAGSQDCLMVLESVQVELDPAALMLPDRDEESDSDDDVQEVERKDDPISLVTSSDEDEVIIQEPKIDTVEVSSGTDEDDVPLVKLVKTKSKKKSNYRSPTNIAKIMWGICDYYCIQCKYNTSSRGDYARHLKNHETVLHICQICGYTTSSKPQFWRHKRKHKDEKRFKCHLCEYKARHSMSLVYHLKSHDGKEGVKCKKCGLVFIEKENAARHGKECKGKLHKCDSCPYATKRLADLRRHMSNRHGNHDKDYTPTYFEFHSFLVSVSCLLFHTSYKLALVHLNLKLWIPYF